MPRCFDLLSGDWLIVVTSDSTGVLKNWPASVCYHSDIRYTVNRYQSDIDLLEAGLDITFPVFGSLVLFKVGEMYI